MRLRFILLGIGPVIALLLVRPAPASAQRPGGYRVTPVPDGATLTGRVTYDGAIPRARRLMITKDVEVCGFGYRERQEIAVSETGGLRSAVVFIEGIEQGKPWPDEPERYTLTQEDCTFAPHVQVVPWGKELAILNPDPVLHNIHGFELIGRASRTLFNFGQPPEKDTIIHPVRPRRGGRIRIECDAHDFMLAWIYAADTPYAVVVDANGRFRLDDIPPGTHTVSVWHPYLGISEREVTLPPGGERAVDFAFSSP